MLVAIDHVIIASADPDADASELEASLGLRAGGGGRHDAHGTFNRLVWLGDSYVELMGVFDAGLAAESWWGAHITRLLAAAVPAALAGMALASDDLDADIARLRAQGSPVSDPVAGERVRPDGEGVRWRIGRLPAPDRDLGLLFLIEHDATAAEWQPADRAARAAEEHPLGMPARLARIELAVPEVRSASLRLLRELGLQFRPSLAGAGARDASVGGQVLRLRPARSDASATIAIRAGHAAHTEKLLGCIWQLEPITPEMAAE